MVIQILCTWLKQSLAWLNSLTSFQCYKKIWIIFFTRWFRVWTNVSYHVRLDSLSVLRSSLIDVRSLKQERQSNSFTWLGQAMLPPNGHFYNYWNFDKSIEIHGHMGKTFMCKTKLTAVSDPTKEMARISGLSQIKFTAANKDIDTVTVSTVK